MKCARERFLLLLHQAMVDAMRLAHTHMSWCAERDDAPGLGGVNREAALRSIWNELSPRLELVAKMPFSGRACC